jgi:CubicO group peptidase (beta-lactamase class C family)
MEKLPTSHEMNNRTNRLKATVLGLAGLLLALGAYAAWTPPMAGPGSAAGVAAGGQDAPSVADLIHRSGQALVEDGTVRGLSMGFLDLEGERVVADFGRSEGGAAYRIASVSKVLVAMAVMQLVEEGRLGLDAPLSAILPDFTVPSRFPESEAITIRHLLTHTSGLSRDRIAGMQSRCPLDDRHLLSYRAVDILPGLKADDSYGAHADLLARVASAGSCFTRGAPSAVPPQADAACPAASSTFNAPTRSA